MPKIALLLLGVSLAGTACSNGGLMASDDVGGVSGSSDLSGLKDFTKVEAIGPDNVIVTAGKPFKVSAEGSQQVLDTLRVEVIDGKLRVGRKNGWESLWKGAVDDEGATIRVSMPSIAAASLTGSGDVRVDGAKGGPIDFSLTGSGNITAGPLQVSQLSADLTGSGDIALSGTADEVEFSATGSGGIDGSGLKAGKAAIKTMGSGDVALASDGLVAIRIMGSGDVDVKGKAQCKVSAMGSGEGRCSA